MTIKKIKVLFINLFLVLFVTMPLSAELPLQIQNISLSKVPIKVALSWLGGLYHKNLAVDSNLEDKISINLSGTNWDEFFNLILEENNLISHRIGRIDLITKVDRLTKYLKAIQALSAAKEIKTEFISLRMRKADELVDRIVSSKGGIISSKVKIVADPRTNRIIASGEEEDLLKLKSLIHNLDQPVSQVLIVAKIVAIDTNAEKRLGIEFNMSHDSVSKGIHIGVVDFFKKNRLDLILGALEQDGIAQIISNPKIMTVNQKPAYIEAGETIPYQGSKNERGIADIEFKKAVLSLKVVPTILGKNRVELEITLNQDRMGSTLINSQPTIITRRLSTNTSLINTSTIVLGGIYEYEKQREEKGVPFFDQLPLLGAFFRYHENRYARRELVIFVTPYICP